MLVSLCDYQYQRLSPGPVFRFLLLAPGSGYEPLRCSIYTAPIAKARFVALSYTWGDATKSHTIICERHVMKITRNLSDALYRLRLPDKPLTLWADSICIDQKSFDEKAHQVALIGRIYSAASKVLLYMGKDDQRMGLNLSLLLQKVERMIEDICYKIDMSWDSFPFPGEDDCLMFDPGWESLRALLQQSWFDRGWVVQEAALAQSGEVIWGDTTFDWDQLMKTYIWLSTRAPDIYHSKNFSEVPINAHLHYYLESHREFAQAFYSEISWGQPSILRTLSAAKELTFGDAHDRIYAFLELPPRIIGLYPNYHRSYLETYLQFALNQVNTTNSPEILDYVCHNNSTLAKLPSWVPRWDVDTWSLGHTASATTTMQPHLSCSKIPRAKGDVLTVNGVIIDKVLYVSDEFDWEATTPATFATIWNHVKRSTVPRPYAKESYTIDHQYLDAFLDVLSAGSFDGDFEEWRLARVSFCIEANLFVYQAEEDGPADAKKTSNIYFSLIRNKTHSRKFMLTERGYMGLAPGITREDDICSIIFGCKTPCILREDVRKDYYKYIGATSIMAKNSYEADGGGSMFCDILGEDGAMDWVDWDVDEQDINLS